MQRIRAPLLILAAGADANIRAEDYAAFSRELSAASVEHEVVTYEGAPHSFFDRKQAEYAEQCADAWRRILGFVERYRARPAAG